MKSAEIRQAFLDYFARHNHQVVSSSSLVPGNDPTLLFTNAGMVQFKEVFTGDEKHDFTRAVSSQRCVRAGGKHNDLENVGYTARHHTFFEMLGNFSFGDYFKRDAIKYAWDFLTEVLEIPAQRLSVTVYQEDDEAAEIWSKHIGLPPERITRLGEKDNFWSMGEIGPCGPCSEIFYDHGPEVAGGPPGSLDEDGDRFVEIWNLVFMQFQRTADGELHSLPKPSVDTGMGLERISAVMQGVHDNYDIDLFTGLLEKALSLFPGVDRGSRSLRVIADHIRSSAFLIVDGVLPSNEGRGYVLRRIIRRAVRHGVMLGSTEPFLYKLVNTLDAEMGGAYPELHKQCAEVEAVLKEEEERFAHTLDLGLELLDHVLDQIQGTVIPGETIFRLYDTYGFPVDLTADIARERGLDMDMSGYELAMDEQRNRARNAGGFQRVAALSLEGIPESRFLGYAGLAVESRVLAIFDPQGELIERLGADQSATVILDQTTFYAESGGQVGDRGKLVSATGDMEFEVADTQKQGAIFKHSGKLLRGELRRGDQVSCEVAAQPRTNTALHHSATHLLHAALRQILGKQVTQKGSLVDANRLRFDFSYGSAMSSNQLAEIQRLVNQQIRANHPIETLVTTMEDAVARGAMALFGEKYGDQVRVLGMGDFSVELCGGTHANRTGDIGFFKIIAETGVAAGVRRIEAVVGARADEQIDLLESRYAQVGRDIHASDDEVPEKIRQLIQKNRELDKELASLKLKLASRAGGELADKAELVGDIKVLAVVLENTEAKSLRNIVDQLKQKLGEAVIVVASVEGDKISLVAGVTENLVSRIKAGDVVNSVAKQVGGKGGGRPDMAMAGGSQPDALPAALASVKGWVTENIQ